MQNKSRKFTSAENILIGMYTSRTSVVPIFLIFNPTTCTFTFHKQLQNNFNLFWVAKTSKIKYCWKIFQNILERVLFFFILQFFKRDATVLKAVSEWLWS